MKPENEDREVPTISSELRWDQVHLPPSISEKDIDGIILSLLEPEWRKVALIVGRVLTRCQELGLPISDEIIAARLQALVDDHSIEGIGDLRMWRFSEVRLKD